MPDRAGPSEQLADLRRATLRRIAGLDESFDAIVAAALDVATDDEHDPEGHTIAWERQQVAGLVAEARRALDDIGAAEQRLADGRYGICVGCGARIAAGRLDALPAASSCVRCAT